MGPHDRDQFDDLLDGALKQHGNVEPRTGLEGRVLARLAANSNPFRIRWVWAVAAVSAVSIILGVWFAALRRGESPPSVALKVPHILTTPHPPQTPREQTVTIQESHPRRTRPPARVALAREPALQQFPSPRPASEQERMLVEYVERYPQEAMLIAKAQDEFQKRVVQAEKEIEIGSSSDQQEK